MKDVRPILIAGGAGYIGSHMVRCLLKEGCRPVVFDNLSTGKKRFVPRGVPFVRGDLLDAAGVRGLFRKYRFRAVMHFAAKSIVPESVSDPVGYYRSNVGGCISLVSECLRQDVPHFIFSSSAAVYGEPARVPIKEEDACLPVHPYGKTKLIMENFLSDVSRAHDLTYVCLRYFNAAGAHEEKLAGEEHDPETHLIPNIIRASMGLRQKLEVYGADYATPDGTCVRDYVHVTDLCEAHYLALKHLENGGESGSFNLGSGRGYSVSEVIRAFEDVSGRKLKFAVRPRRPGDPARLVADCSLARRVLGWEPRRSLSEMIASAWAYGKVHYRAKRAAQAGSARRKRRG